MRNPLDTVSPTDVDTRSELRLAVMPMRTSIRHAHMYGTKERTMLPNSATIGGGGVSSGNGTSREPAWPTVGSTFASGSVLATEGGSVASSGGGGGGGGAGGESMFRTAMLDPKRKSGEPSALTPATARGMVLGSKPVPVALKVAVRSNGSQCITGRRSTRGGQ